MIIIREYYTLFFKYAFHFTACTDCHLNLWKYVGERECDANKNRGKKSWLRSLNNCDRIFFSRDSNFDFTCQNRQNETLLFFQIYWKCLSFNWKISKVFLQHHIHWRNIASISQVVWNFWLFKWNSKLGIVVLLHS